MTSSFNLSAWALQNRSLVKFAMVISLLAGLLAFQKLGRQEDPNFEIPLMTALVGWPGATPDEIQNQILNRMEQAVQELPNLRYVTSFARQGYGGLTLAIDGRNSGAELRALWYQVRKKIGDIRNSLPADMQGPLFNDEYNDVYSALYALEAEGITQAELEEFASGIKRTLQKGSWHQQGQDPGQAEASHLRRSVHPPTGRPGRFAAGHSRCHCRSE